MNEIQLYWHVHHGRLVETLTEPVENRIEYIKHSKPRKEVFLRLALMRPVKNIPYQVKPILARVAKATRVLNALNKRAGGYLDSGVVTAASNEYNAALNALEAEFKKSYWNAAHKTDCDPYCPWNGSTIFPQ